jgi:hypothetical protein
MNIDKLNNNEPEKPFHSSGYAEVANGGSIGSTNSQTFNQRYAADQDRTFVRKYRDSHIARGSMRHHARNGVTDPFVRTEPTMPTSRQSDNASSSPVKPTSPSSPVAPPARSSFREPPTRGFNPYH